MGRYNHILLNPEYLGYLDRIKMSEFEREFCGHNIEHFLDVARIAYIIALEKKLPIAKDCIYAAALLHDIGRWQQYEMGIPHHEASAALAAPLLQKAGYCEVEIEVITAAILKHRSDRIAEWDLNRLLYESDKLSRVCFHCKVRENCHWSEDKKNLTMKY